MSNKLAVTLMWWLKLSVSPSSPTSMKPFAPFPDSVKRKGGMYRSKLPACDSKSTSGAAWIGTGRMWNKHSHICPFNHISMPYQLMRLEKAECHNTAANKHAGKSVKTLTLGIWSSAGFQTTYFLNENQAHIAANPLLCSLVHKSTSFMHSLCWMVEWQWILGYRKKLSFSSSSYYCGICLEEMMETMKSQCVANEIWLGHLPNTSQ